MHPQHDSIFVYEMSKGSLKIYDLRISVNFKTSSNCLKVSGDKKRKSFFDLISSISSATFSKNNRYLISRDYLIVKFWDIVIFKKPLSDSEIYEGFKSRLGELF